MTTSRRRATIAAALGSLVVFALPNGVEAADPPQKTERAACVKAYEQSQYLRREQKLRDAREALLVCASADCPAATRDDCVPWLAEVEAAIPSAVIAIRDASQRDVIDAVVTVDGVKQPTANGQAILLNPGPHTIHVEASEGRIANLDVVLRVGDKNRRFDITLPTKGKDAAAVVTTSPTPPTTAGASSNGERSLALPIALASVGAIGLGAAVFFGLGAKSDADDMRDTCAPNCSQSRIDDAQSKLLFSDIGLGVFVVGVGVATVLYLTGSPAPKSSNSPTSQGGAIRGFQLAF